MDYFPNNLPTTLDTMIHTDGTRIAFSYVWKASAGPLNRAAEDLFSFTVRAKDDLIYEATTVFDVILVIGDMYEDDLTSAVRP